MARSSVTTVEEYLAGLPPPRREVVAVVRDALRAAIPKGYVECMNWGMICYEVPLERYPKTYNKQPLSYVLLAARKNYCTLSLMSVYMDPAREAALRAAFASAGKKLDMGKACIRFRRVEDLPLEAIADLLAATPPDEFISYYEAARRAPRGKDSC